MGIEIVSEQRKSKQCVGDRKEPVGSQRWMLEM